MALSASIQKTLRMKPEVSKIFDDLEAWHDHCRLELIEFNPAHLYKSYEYKTWARDSHRNKNKKLKNKNGKSIPS